MRQQTPVLKVDLRTLDPGVEKELKFQSKSPANLRCTERAVSERQQPNHPHKYLKSLGTAVSHI